MNTTSRMIACVWRMLLLTALVTGLALGVWPARLAAAASSYTAWADLGIVYSPPDNTDAYYPSVIYDADGFGSGSSLHKMWYTDGAGGVFVTTSSNGVSWGTPTAADGGLGSDAHHVQVLYDPDCFGAVPCGSSDTHYKIWYWDIDADLYSISAIATAESSDGLTWTNDTSLTQSPTSPLVIGGGSGWNRGSYGPIYLFYQPGAANTGTQPWDYSYVMYYDGTDGSSEVTGMAYSADGLYWTAASSLPVLDKGAGSAWDCDDAAYGTVYHDAGGYHFWYSGGGGDNGSGACSSGDPVHEGIGYASSPDGQTWTKDAANPILHISDGVSYRDRRVYTPAVVDDGSGVLKMYYSAQASGSGQPKKIGLAVMSPGAVFVDDDWVGLPLLTEVTFPGDPDPHYIGLDAFATIQQGVDAVADGGTVHVAAGVYTETMTFGPAFAKNNLTIIGDAADRPVVTGGVNFQNSGTIDGLSLANLYLKGDGSGGANRIVNNGNTGTINDFALTDCVLDGENVSGRLGLYGNKFGQSFTITGTEFKDILGFAVMDIDGSSDYSPWGGNGLPLTTVTFADNHIHECNGSVALRGHAITRTTQVDVYENTWENIGGNAGETGEQWAALEVNHAEQANVYANTVSNVALGAWGEGQAFQLWDIGALDVYGNHITDNAQGIYVFGGGSGNPYGGPYAVPGGAIHNNHIAGNAEYGVRVDPNATGGPLDASGNWWGDNTPTGVAAQVSANVDYSPWLDDGTDTSADPGFQGDLAVLDVDDDSPQSGSEGRIQEALDLVTASTVNVFPGFYDEFATHRWVLGVNGPHQFGLFIDQDGVTLQGVDSAGAPITDYHNIQASVQTNATNNFGYSGVFVEGDGVTITGLEILPNVGGDNKTIEVIGDDFTLKHAHLNITDGGSVYLNDWQFDELNNVSHLQSYTIQANWLDHGTSVDLASGAGFSGPLNGRVIQDNVFSGGGAYWALISFNGSGTCVPWFVYGVGGAVISGNDFSGGEQYIRARGDYDNSQFDWAAYWNDNTFDKAAVVGPNPPADVREFAYDTWCGAFEHVRRIGSLIQEEVDHGASADVVLASPGTFVEQVEITQTLTLRGSGVGATVIQSPDTLTLFFTTSADNYPIVYAHDADGIALEHLTVDGAGKGNANYRFVGVGYANAGGAVEDVEIVGIRETPISGNQHGVGLLASAESGAPRSLSISDSAISDYQKNGIVVAGADLTVDITGNVVTGAGAVDFIAQNGIQVSSGALAVVSDNTVSGHSYTPFTWVSSGILLYYADTDTYGNTISENQVGLYHIDGSGAHEGNTVSASSAGTGSSYFWGMVFDDPPPTRLPSPYDPVALAGHAGILALPPSQVVVVRNNVFTGDGTSAGIGLEADAGYYPGAHDIDLTATNNIIENWGVGVTFWQCTGGGCSEAEFTNLTFNLNSISGNLVGVDNGSGFAAAGESNWWGDATGPSGAGAGAGDSVSADVDYDPWLCDGADTDPAIGFQPDPTFLCGGAPPDTVIDAGPADPTNDASATFIFHGTDDVTPPAALTFECQLDGGGWSACASPASYTGLSDGPHTFEVRAKDPAGNVDPTPAVWTWVIDAAPPVTTASVTGATRTCGPYICYVLQATVALAANEPATTYYRVNGGGWQTYTGPFAVTSEGDNTVEFYSVDTAGNIEATQSVTFKITSLVTGVLDNFDRPDGLLGASWWGATKLSNYRIVGNQVDVGTGGQIFWRGASFGSDQEAFVTLTQVDPWGVHQLLLKVQGVAKPTINQGAIKVYYNAKLKKVGVMTFVPGVGWKTVKVLSMTLFNGDQLGARVLANGDVYVYVNCVRVTQVNAGSFFANKGGWIGLWFGQAPSANFDDFGGGNH